MNFDWMKGAFGDIFDKNKDKKEKAKIFNEKLKENIDKNYEVCRENKIPMLSFYDFGLGCSLSIAEGKEDTAIQAAYLILKAKMAANEKGEHNNEVKMLLIAITEKTAEAMSDILKITKKSDEN